MRTNEVKGRTDGVVGSRCSILGRALGLRRAWIGAGVALLLGAAGPVGAERPPLPKVDFEAVAEVADLEGDVRVRHKAGGRLGRWRLEGAYQGQPVTLLLDPSTRTMTMLLMQGRVPVAMDMDIPRHGFLLSDDVVDGRRVGGDTVAGSRCEIWDIHDRESGERGRACLTGDGIPLKVERLEGGKHRLVYEVRRFERASQDADRFSPPRGTMRMRVPHGAAIPGLPQGGGR